ncbi:hypothetical protein AAMO2058_000371100 [Amorphochlora amoebiformis]
MAPHANQMELMEARGSRAHGKVAPVVLLVALVLLSGFRPERTFARPKSGLGAFLRRRGASNGGEKTSATRSQVPKGSTKPRRTWLRRLRRLKTQPEEKRASPEMPNVILILLGIGQVCALLTINWIHREDVRLKALESPSEARRARIKCLSKFVTLPLYDKFLVYVIIMFGLELSLAVTCWGLNVRGRVVIDTKEVMNQVIPVVRIYLGGSLSFYLVQYDMGWPAVFRSVSVAGLIAVAFVASRIYVRYPNREACFADIGMILFWIGVGLTPCCRRKRVKGKHGIAFHIFVVYLISLQLVQIVAGLKVDGEPLKKIADEAIDICHFCIFPWLLYAVLHEDTWFWRGVGQHIKGLGRRKHSFLDFMPDVKTEDIKVALDAQVAMVDFTRLDLSGAIVARGATARIFRTKYYGRSVAIKSYQLDPFTIEAVLDFSKEAFLYSQLEHPNIVKFYGVCVAPPEFFLICEYCSHQSLLKVLQSRMELDWATRVKFILDAARGMAFAHEQNIMHRDLKTMNLLVHHNGVEYIVKVCDFGSSRMLSAEYKEVETWPEEDEMDDDSKMTGVVGTVAYMAPELLRSLVSRRAADMKMSQRKLSMYSFAVDIFSFGYVMWEVLTRRMPYAGMRIPDIKAAVLAGHMPILPRSHPDRHVCRYIELIDMCWRPSPFARPTFDRLVEELENILKVAYEDSPFHVTADIDNLIREEEKRRLHPRKVDFKLIEPSS